MTTTTIVRKIIADATLAASKNVYNNKEKIVFGLHPDTKLWRAMIVGVNYTPTSMAESPNREQLLDDVFDLIEARGSRLLVVIDNIGREY